MFETTGRMDCHLGEPYFGKAAAMKGGGVPPHSKAPSALGMKRFPSIMPVASENR